MAAGHLVALGGKKKKISNEIGKEVEMYFVPLSFSSDRKKMEAFVESSWTLGSYP